MRIVTAFIALFLIGPVVVWAHDGETHSTPDILSLPEPGTHLLAVSGTTEQFEVVVKYSKTATYDNVPITVFLSHTATNEPVSGAQIELQIPDTEINVEIDSTDVPGIYKTRLVLPRLGSYNLILAISAGDVMDLMVVNGLDLVEDSLLNKTQSGHVWLWGVGVVLGLLILIGVLKRRGQR